jgi:hypothetical protein
MNDDNNNSNNRNNNRINLIQNQKRDYDNEEVRIDALRASVDLSGLSLSVIEILSTNNSFIKIDRL